MQQIDVDGSKGPIEEYNPEELIKALDNPKVKEVCVFRLEKGMVVEIKGKSYEVGSLNSNGKKLVLHLSRIYTKKDKKK